MRRSILVATLLTTCVLLPAARASGEPAPSSPAVASAAQRELEAAWDEFAQAIADSVAFLRQHPFYGGAEDRAGAYAFLSSMIVARIEDFVVFDPDFPYFHVLDHRIREGGDNPDQRYLISSLTGGETYRIWGRLGGARRLDLQVYAGNPFVPGSGGRVASFLPYEQLARGADGSFEVFLAPQPHSGNWLANPREATSVLVRQVFSDWEHETPGEVHIDRVGHEGELKPVVDERAMAARLRTAAADLRLRVRHWPQFVHDYNVARRAPNELSAPTDPGALGGVPGRYNSSGHWELADDEALIIRTWPMSGNYQGIQLADLWFSSLEYANRQTSLTGDQARLSPDGSYYFVLAGRDPGVPNWLDTTGRRRGVMLLRFDGIREQGFDPAKYPTTARVKFAAIRAHLPAGTPTVTPEERARDIAARRRHVQQRFGD
jgi:hypothetical protein